MPVIAASKAQADDDTSDVQGQIYNAWATGGAVQLEARDYYVSGLQLPDGATRSLTIRGAGRSYNDAAYAVTKGGTRIICLTKGASALAYNGTGALHRPTFTIEDLTILGTGTKVDPGGGHGIRINGGTSVPIVLIRNVFVAWFYGGAGIWLSNCENGSVVNTHTQLCQTGFRADAAYNANAHLNLSAELCQTGILIENSESLSFSGGMAQSNEGNGLVLRNVTAASFSAMHFENNNRLSQADSWAILIEAGQGITFDQCSCIFPRDRAMVRSGARAVRFVGGKNIATAPAITIDSSARGCLVDECVPPVNVSGAARIIWDGVVT